MLRYSFVLILLGTVAHVAQALSVETMCVGHPSGTLLPNPRDCNSYYVCQSGPSLAYCGHGLHFDRVQNVCNWPQWANCKLDELDTSIGEFEKESHEKSEANLGEQIETYGVEEKEEKPQSMENSEEEHPMEPIKANKTTDAIKDLTNYKESSGEKSLNPLDSSKYIEKDGRPTLEVKVPLAREINGTVLDQQPSTIRVKVAVSSQVSDTQSNLSAGQVNLLDTKDILQPLNLTEELEATIPVEKIDSLKISADPVAPSAVNISHAAEVNSAEQTSNQVADVAEVSERPSNTVIVNVRVPLSPDKMLSAKPTKEVTNEQNPNVTKLEGITELNLSQGLGQVVELPSNLSDVQEIIENREIKNSSLDAAGNLTDHLLQSQQIVEKIESIDSLQSSDQVIELILPDDVPAFPANVSANPAGHPASPDGFQDSSLPQQIVEKIASESSSQASNQVIDLPSSEVIPALIPDTQDTDSATLQTGNVIEIIDLSSKLEDPHESIDLSEPDNVPAAEVIDLQKEDSPQAEVLIEKIESSSSNSNPSHVIEVQVPEESIISQQSNENHDASIEIHQAEDNVVKIESPTPVQGSSMIIELPNENIINEDENIDAVPLDADAISAVIEKIDSEKHNIGTGQILDLPDPEIPPPILNTLIENPSSEGKDSSLLSMNPPPVVIVSSVPNAVAEHLPPPIHTTGDTSANVHADLSLSNESDEGQTSDSDDEEKVERSSEEDQSKLSVDSSDEDASSMELHHPLTEESEESAEKVEELTTNRSSEKKVTGSHKKPIKKGQNPTIHELPAEGHVIPSTGLNCVEPLNPNPIISIEGGSEEFSKSDESNNEYEYTSGVKPAAPDTAPTNQNFNLIVTILSVERPKNSTHIPPVVGAHDVYTGHPIDPLNGYNTNNVQCLHNGLYFLPHPAHCKKYFICAYHHLHLHSCGDGLIWSYKREQCEIESSTSRCFLKDSSRLPEPEIRKPSSPNNNEVITPTPKKPPTPTPPIRDTQPKAETSNPGRPLPSCPGLQQVYLPSLDDCNKYYICILSHPILTSCPDDLHWDMKREICSTPDLAHCVLR